MKETMASKSLRISPRRLGVAEAKSKLSEALREVVRGPTIIHSRGRDLAVLLDIQEYDRLVADSGAGVIGGAHFLDRVDSLKRELGGGVERFEPERVRFVPREPFGRARRRRP
ncbi:MAG: type II toxin-antitoxin system prevent-host-death family antitoxin [Deltaproteobacteria bacterium]|nr:type II toxin-antitoxin system prevent-host-death family antitoxin [Deltaproteobacteria bacterium]